MVMGESCTRGCRFCSVASRLKPEAPDPEEPRRLAETLSEMGLEYAVITTVCRDDLPDQGAAHLAACISAVKERCPRMLLEVLIQDFRGNLRLLGVVAEAGADVLAHNLETVDRLTPLVRDAKAGYKQSLDVLKACRTLRPATPTKSSLMLGLGETEAELLSSFEDLRSAGVEILTLGQYLRPTTAARHLPVAEYVPPSRFDSLGEAARRMGFLYVASGPFVRSSYRAGELFLKGLLRRENADLHGR
jgi:lipoic acid synthetase